MRTQSQRLGPLPKVILIKAAKQEFQPQLQKRMLTLFHRKGKGDTTEGVFLPRCSWPLLEQTKVSLTKCCPRARGSGTECCRSRTHFGDMILLPLSWSSITVFLGDFVWPQQGAEGGVVCVLEVGMNGRRDDRGLGGWDSSALTFQEHLRPPVSCPSPLPLSAAKAETTW